MLRGSEPRAEFIGPRGERVLVILHPPVEGPSRGCVLIVPPFAEEMNKSRRMAFEVSRSLAQSGFAAVCVDVFGTGDSDGDFQDATWARWVSDIALAAGWVADQGYPVTGMIGIRLGCALAAEAAGKLSAPLTQSVFWHPLLDGARALEQFLRLRVAASLMDQDRKETVRDLRSRLHEGQTLEVAGYSVSAALAAGMSAVHLSVLSNTATGRIHWIEVVREFKDPPEATNRAIESLRTGGRSVQYQQLAGEPFWASTEIVVVPQLITRTVEVCCEAA